MHPSVFEIGRNAGADRAVIDSVRAVLLRQLSIQVYSDDEDLLAAGLLDSLNLVRLISHIEEQFAIDIPISEVGLDSFRSVSAIAEAVQDRRAAPVSSDDGLTLDARGALAGDIRTLMDEKLSLHVDDVDADLFQTGQLDSMLLVQLILELEGRFGLLLPLEDLDLASFRSVSSIAGLIASRR